MTTFPFNYKHVVESFASSLAIALSSNLIILVPVSTSHDQTAGSVAVRSLFDLLFHV